MSQYSSVSPTISPIDFQAIAAFCLAEQSTPTKSSSLDLSYNRSEGRAKWTGQEWVWRSPLTFKSGSLATVLKSWGVEISVSISSNMASSLEQSAKLIMLVAPYFEDPDIKKLGLSVTSVRVNLLKLAQLQAALKSPGECFLYGYGDTPQARLAGFLVTSDAPGFWKVDLTKLVSEFARKTGEAYVSALNEQLKAR